LTSLEVCCVVVSQYASMSARASVRLGHRCRLLTQTTDGFFPSFLPATHRIGFQGASGAACACCISHSSSIGQVWRPSRRHAGFPTRKAPININ